MLIIIIFVISGQVNNDMTYLHRIVIIINVGSMTMKSDDDDDDDDLVILQTGNANVLFIHSTDKQTQRKFSFHSIYIDSKNGLKTVTICSSSSSSSKNCFYGLGRHDSGHESIDSGFKRKIFFIIIVISGVQKKIHSSIIIIIIVAIIVLININVQWKS